MTIISDMYNTQAALGLQCIISDFRHDREMANREKNAADWVSYAKSLEEKLAETQDKLSVNRAEYIKSEAGLVGREAVIDVLTAELAKTDPSNPLLDEKNRRKISLAAQSPVYERFGYRISSDGKIEKI